MRHALTDAQTAGRLEQENPARINPDLEAVSRPHVFGFSDFDGQKLVIGMLNIGKGRGTQCLRDIEGDSQPRSVHATETSKNPTGERHPIFAEAIDEACIFRLRGPDCAETCTLLDLFVENRVHPG